MKRRRVAVALPRPKGTRASSRVELAITMHPRELARLEERAAAASMSLRAYVVALLESDAEDLPSAPKRAPRINWLEDKAIAELMPRRCGVLCPIPCTRPVGHDGDHDPDYLRPERIAADDARRLPELDELEALVRRELPS